MRFPPQEDVKEGDKNCTIEEKMPPAGKCRPLSCHAAMNTQLLWAGCPPLLKVPHVSGYERMVEQWYGSSQLSVFNVVSCCFHVGSMYVYMYIYIHLTYIINI